MEERNDTITIKKDALWKYSTFVLAALVVVLAFVAFSGDDSTVTGNVVAPNPTPGQPAQVTASADDDAVLGDENAKVTIVEFSDYQCPFCRKFWTETYPQLKAEYLDTGKAKLVFRDFPLERIHPLARKSGEAAECVREQGGDEAYFKMHDKMFAEQNILDGGSESGPVTRTITYTTDDLKAWAKELGYDIGSCLDSDKYASEVQKDTADAQTSTCTGTPCFIVVHESGRGTKLNGAVPLAHFKSVIDPMLA